MMESLTSSELLFTAVGVSAEEAGRSLAKLTEILKGNGSVNEAMSTIEGDSSPKVYAVIRK